MNPSEISKWRHPSRNPTSVPLNEIARLVAGAADAAAIRTLPTGTQADVTHAALFAALECAFYNGLIQLVPAEEWPDFIISDPPYRVSNATGGQLP